MNEIPEEQTTLFRIVRLLAIGSVILLILLVILAFIAINSQPVSNNDDFDGITLNFDVSTPVEPVDNLPRTIVYDLAQSGDWLAIAKDSGVSIYRLTLTEDTWQMTLHLQTEMRGRLVNFSPDGTLLAVSQGDTGEGLVIDVESGEVVFAMPQTQRIALQGALYAFAGDTITIYDSSTQQFHDLGAVNGPALDVGFTKDSQRLIVATPQALYVWDVAQWQAAPEQIEIDGFRDMVFGLNDRYVVVAESNTVKVVNLRNARELAQNRELIRGNIPDTLLLSPDDQWLAMSRNQINTILMVQLDFRGGRWRLIPNNEGTPHITTLQVNTALVDWAFVDDGHILTASANGTLSIWDYQSGVEVATFEL